MLHAMVAAAGVAARGKLPRDHLIAARARRGFRVRTVVPLLGTLVPLLVCGGVLTSLVACSSESSGRSPGAEAEAVPVVVAAAAKRDVPIQVRAIGTVEPLSTVAVKSQVEGQLAQIHFQEGQEVEKGQLLFTIDPRSFEASLRQAEANLARDQAEAKNAEVEEKRLGQLVAKDLVSKSEYDQAFAKAMSMRAALAADRAAVESSQIQLQYCYIHAPLSGRVGQLLVHEGNVVKANDITLAVINQVRPVFVAFSVPQQELPGIRARAAAGALEVSAAVTDREKASPSIGELTFINNTVDVNSGTVRLKAQFPNTNEQLWPGQFVDVALTLATQRDAIVVPVQAVQVGQRGEYVFVVGTDFTVAVRDVVTGGSDGSDAVITQGLTPGEQVVVDGQLRLAPGMRVEVKDAATAERRANERDRATL